MHSCDRYRLSGITSTPTKSPAWWRSTLAVTALTALLGAMLAPVGANAAGTWTKITHQAPSLLTNTLLLTDGTVMGADGNNSWYKLTPDIHGSYQNGTWTQLANMQDTRLYYSSQVLPDGNVYVAGGEYGSGGSSAEIYNTLTNTWTYTSPTTLNEFADANSILLPNGSILQSNRGAAFSLYDPIGDTWTSSASCPNMNETDWVRLPDNSILALTNYTTTTARYFPTTNQWVSDADVPVQLFGFGAELGSGHVLPNGKVFWLGGTAVTAIYTPSGNSGLGSWIAGPAIPNDYGAVDAPASPEFNGKILCVLGVSDDFGNEAFFYEYDYTTNQFTQIPDPNNNQDMGDPIQPYVTSMLALPDGSILYQGSDGIHFYMPEGVPLAAGKPTIVSVTPNQDGTFHLIGTGLNGISQGAKYGDDKQMDSNYPIVRLTSKTNGNVYYARTFNWIPGRIMTGNENLSTDFSLPAGLPQDNYDVVAVANGFPSAPVAVALPVVANATFVTADTTTHGNWKDAYGSEGYNVIGDPSTPHYPDNVTVTPGSHTSGVWTSSTLASNCLERPSSSSSDRVAGVWYQTSWSINLSVQDTNPHKLALYLLDYTNAGYAETITIRDAVSNAVLDTRTASNFANGVYYVWNVQGNVKVTLTSTAGHWAVLSGLFIGSGAGGTAPTAPINLTAVPGNQQATLSWTASAGATSYNLYRGTAPGAEVTAPVVAGITGTSRVNTGLTPGATYYYKVVAVNAAGISFASAERSVTIPTGSATFVRTDTTTQGNWKSAYGGDGFNVVGDTSAGNPSYPSYASVVVGSHTSGIWTASTLAPNCLSKAAAGSVDRMAGVWYNTSWSTNFSVTGTHQLALYLLDFPNLGYAETITVKDTASGAVLDTRSASSMNGGIYEVWNVSGNVTVTLTSTAGHWAVLSGIFFGPAAVSKPPTAPTGVAAKPGSLKATLTWTASAGATSYNVYRSATAGGETPTALATGVTATTYVDSGLTANKTYYYKVIAVNAVGGSPTSAEVSATIPSASAVFVKTDTTTQGAWKGVYGADGFNIIGDTSAGNPTYPAYATIAPGSHTSGVWAASSTAANCLQKAAAGSTDRVAGFWSSSSTSWSINVNVTGTHQLALYLLDFPNSGYGETITIKDAASGQVLDSEAAANFNAGIYEVWNITGNVTVTFTTTAGRSVLSGIFLG